MKRLSKKKEDKLLGEFKDHVNLYQQAFQTNAINYQKMITFCNGDQWDQEIRRFYEADRITCLTINHISPIMSQIIGEFNLNNIQLSLRKIGLKEGQDFSKMNESVFNAISPQQKPQQPGNATSDISQLIKHVRVIPEDPKLKVIEGLARQICTNQEAQEAYHVTARGALEGGYGAFRIIMDYSDEYGVFQDIRIEKIQDATYCYWDLTAKHATKCDGDYCGIAVLMNTKRFKEEYPDAEVVDVSLMNINRGPNGFYWGDKDRILVGEEYRREKFTDEEAILNDGSIIYKSSFSEEEEFEKYIKDKEPRRHSFKNYKICHYKYTAAEVLEYTETPFKKLPILFCDGNSYHDNGLQITKSFAQGAVDPQKELNLIATQIALWLSMAKKAQHMAPDEILTDKHMKIWNQTGNPSAVLPYNGTKAKELGLKPEPAGTPQIPQDLMVTYARLVEDIKTSLGYYEANTGAQGNEKSGIAIAYRAMEGAKAKDIYRANLRNAIEMAIKIVIETLPKIYDDERIVTIVNRDKNYEEVTINKPIFNFQKLEYEYNVDLKNMGEWQAEVILAPNLEILEQIERNTVVDIIAKDPSGRAFGLLAPYIVENIRTPNARQMAARLAFLTDPHVLAAEQGKQFTPPPNPMEELQMKAIQAKVSSDEAKAMKEQMEAQNLKIEAMAKQLTAMGNYMKGKAAIDQVEMEKEMQPMKMQTELLHGMQAHEIEKDRLHHEKIKHLHDLHHSLNH